MATVRHAFDSAKDDPVDSSIVGASKWDADHDLEGFFEYLTPTGSDDTAMLAAAIAAAPEGGTLFLSGTFLGTIDIVGGRVKFASDGTAVIRGTSAGPIISVDGDGDISGYGLSDLKVINDGAGGGVELRRVHHSRFSNVLVLKCGGTAWQTYGCLLNQFDNCQYTVNEDFPASGNAKIGWAFDYDATLDSGTNANTFVNCIAEGCTVSPGVGFDFVNAAQNTFWGPTSEGNTIGVRWGAAAYTNQIHGAWMEANGTDMSGTIGSNSITYNRLVAGNNRERQIFNGDVYLRNVATGEVLGIGLPEGTALGATMRLLTSAAGVAGFIIDASASQTEDLQKWRDAAAAVMVAIGPTGKLLFGAAGDTNLYRAGASLLETDDTFLAPTVGLTSATGIIFDANATGDTNLFREAANKLKTDDAFKALVLATTGLTGATTALRIVGGTASGAPTTGTFAVNDVVVAANGHIFVCTVAGTPGTWVDVGGSGGTPAASAVTVDSTTLVGTGTNQQAVDEEFDNAIVAAQATADNHVADTSTAHAAASVDAVAVGGGGTETVKAVGNTGSTETIALALADGNVQTFTVNADCVFTMPSSLGAGAKSFTAILTDSGGPRAITFTGVKWSGGANPTVMSGASAVDIFTFLTIDGGTTWYGFIGGQAMAV